MDDLTRDEWLVVDEVAELFRVNAESVRRWIRAGDLPVLDLGGARMGYRIRRADLARFSAARYGPIARAQPSSGSDEDANGGE